jgi:hypothetical protein
MDRLSSGIVVRMPGNVTLAGIEPHLTTGLHQFVVPVDPAGGYTELSQQFEPFPSTAAEVQRGSDCRCRESFPGIRRINGEPGI